MSTHVAERRLANLAALAVAIDIEHFLHGFQLLAAHDVAEFLLRERHACAEDFLLLLFEIGRDRFQEFGAECCRSYRSPLRLVCAPSAGRVCGALRVNGVDDVAFGHAKAATNGLGVRHLCDVESGVGGRRGNRRWRRCGVRSVPFLSQSL